VIYHDFKSLRSINLITVPQGVNPRLQGGIIIEFS